VRAAEWFRQLLGGLQFAHDLDIVHRDLKPENVMIVGDDVKIMDFGLAKVIDPSGKTESVTVAGNMMGTLGYMAPEMLTGAAQDERADLFAIGVMLVETVTGARPFMGATPQEILAALLRTDYHLGGDSPDTRALNAVIQRCLAKDPRDRYASAAELAADLVPPLARCRDLDGRAGSTSLDSPTI
jgi:eukaryotic-like serine/threonine-protein kinase